MSDQGTSGKLALARTRGRRLALVVDEEDHALRAIDLDARVEVTTFALAGKPTSLLALRDGRLLVTTVAPPRLIVLEPSDGEARSFEERCSLEVGVEPIAIAVTPDESSIAVVSRWDASLWSLDGRTLASRSRVTLARDPSAVIASLDGERMVVAHASGSRSSLVALATGTVTDNSLSVRDERQMAVLPSAEKSPTLLPTTRRTIHVESFALVRTENAFLAPGVSIDAGNGVRSFASGYGDDIPVMGTVTALDRSSAARSHAQRRIPFGHRDCLLPRAAALAGTRLYVACAGIDSVISLDATRPDPRVAEDPRDRRSVGRGPVGLAVDADRRELVVYAEIDRAVSIEPLAPKGARVVIPLGARRLAIDDAVELGRHIFLGEARRRLADDGRSCVSCHAGGRDDGLTWTTPDGPRQTPLLIERLTHAAPFGWNGAVPTLLAHVTQTVARLGGSGLDERERAALIAYIDTLRSPVAGSANTKTSRRGAELFASEAVGCAGCHPNGGTDGLGHDVGGHARGDRMLAIDTPSLRHVGRSAPYFHDGRFVTLDELLRQTDGKMGRTGQLAEEDREALKDYVLSL